MKRWHIERKQDVESVRVEEFLSDLIYVCDRHGLSLSHEDSQGSFVVEPYSDDANAHLIQAMISGLKVDD